MALLGAALALALVLALAGCQGEGDDKRGDPFAAAKRRVLTLQPTAPRWERVARLEGSTNKSVPLAISTQALRWRVRWRCSSGPIRLSATPRPPGRRTRPGGNCRKPGEASWVQTGPVRLSIAAQGHWSVVVEQQLDTPLREPPLPAMRSSGARLLARGRFHPIESPGKGAASLYRLPTGRLALRFEDLRTSAYPNLFVWVSKARNPQTTAQSANSAHVQLGPLKSTRGDQNYLLPKTLDRDAIGSVVIWWAPVRMAYTAAPLK